MVIETIQQMPLPPVLAEALCASRSILDLPDDWDEEGSPRFREATWQRATKLVKLAATAFQQRFGVWIEPPRILPAPEGSIDLHWRLPERELLINIPERAEAPADYYGSGNAQAAVKGKLNTSLPNEWILLWLTR
ncbi:MAG: hypothetical protein HOP19_13085 [Acidobacteria bacterium]|nr:hypothetical protein [Acidobacteriota bacterium]